MTKKNVKKRSIFYPAFFTAIFFIFILFWVSNHLEAPTVENLSKNDEIGDVDMVDIEELPSYSEAKIVAVGDIIIHTPQLSQARIPETGGYDFTPSFDIISPYLKEADLAVGNFESTLAGRDRGYDGYPLFNSPDEFAKNLKEIGFDIMCTANNHSLDRGESGLYRTIDIFKENNISVFGTAKNTEESNTPLIVEINDIKIAFLAYTDSTNGIPLPYGKEYIINYINLNSDPELQEAALTFREDIDDARDAGAEIVAVYMHWGYEYHFEPSSWQKKLTLLLAESGADIILGSHPHVIQPMEYLTVEKEDGEMHKTFVAYSMGNFISNQHFISGAIPTEEVKYGLMLYITIEKNLLSGETMVKDVEYLITWVNRDWRHRVIPVYNALAEGSETNNIPEYKYNRLQPVSNNIKERLDGFTSFK